MRRARALRLNKEPRTIFICRHSAIKLATQGATRRQERNIANIILRVHARETRARYVRQTRYKARAPVIAQTDFVVVIVVVEFLWPALRMPSTASVLNTNKISSVSS